MCVPYVRAAQLSHVELLHLLFNLTTLWSIGDFEARDGFAAKGGAAYYVQISIILLLLSGVVSTFSINSRQHTAKFGFLIPSRFLEVSSIDLLMGCL